MKVLVTGAYGFLGRNLARRLHETGHEVLPLGRDDPEESWRAAVREAQVVVHLAGINRPRDDAEFATGNTELTHRLCALLADAHNDAPVIFASSTQAVSDNAYGRSKAAAEQALLTHARATGAPVAIFRLPNVFGKWARPEYNSAVATFCHRIARDEPITVHDAAAPLSLVYVDDVIEHVLALLHGGFETGYHAVTPVYKTTVGTLAGTIRGFRESRATLTTPPVGTGLVRALYSTYLSYMPVTAVDYTVPIHQDLRGRFVEMLKTEDSGQFSYFTALPGVTRGEHYHHTKVEKFLVIAGRARFAFRQIESDERHEIVVAGGDGRIVETLPGWAHNVTNIGDDELIVMLWANEIFDRSRPDTVAMKV